MSPSQWGSIDRSAKHDGRGRKLESSLFKHRVNPK